MKKVLIFIETYNDAPVGVSLEIAIYTATNFGDSQINGILLTTEERKDVLVQKLKNKGFDNVFVFVDSKFKTSGPKACTTAISDFLKQNPQDVFLMGATALGRELAPRIAARNDLGLTADCTQIALDENGKLLATRPTYGGQLMATIVSKTTPDFATVRPGALKSSQSVFLKHTDVIDYNSDLNNIVEAVRIIKSENKGVDNGLETAQIIVAGGLGMKTKENFEMISKFAQLIGAKPAASRAAVELGWAPQEIQVGQTGHSVAPKLYIAFGISGAMQHIVGISNSDKIIAINTDKSAPIFESADIGIVADAPEFLKELIEKLDTEE